MIIKNRKTSAGIMRKVFMFVLARYKFRHDVFINAENHGMFSCHEHWNGEHGLNMSFCAEVDWVITKWPLTPSLSCFKNTSLLRWSLPSLSGDIVGIASGSSMQPHRTGCEGPRSKHVCSKCALHKNECSVGPDHFALVSFTLVVQIKSV